MNIHSCIAETRKSNRATTPLSSTTLFPNFYHVTMQYTSCKHAFTIRVKNSVDPDQMALSEASLFGSTVFEKG